MNKEIFLPLFVIIIFFTNISLNVSAQTLTPSPTPTEIEKNEEVIKIDSGLVQTSVTVLDKNGKFVTGLSKDDFGVQVDKKDVSVTYFDAVSKSRNVLIPKTKNSGKPEAQSDIYPEFGKNILFYVDDHHLSPEGTKRVTDIISKFIKNEMNSQDLVAIISPTNRIGFLQQFSNDKTMLLTALEKLKGISGKPSFKDAETPPMTPYEALLIDRNDREVLDNFYEVEKRLNVTLDSKERFIARMKARARTLLSQESIYSSSSLKNLAAALKYAQKIPGRKVVVYLSEGFLVDQKNTDNLENLRRITDMAVRSDSVIYSFDVKGLESGMSENTTSGLSPNGLGFRVQGGERKSLLDGLSDMAASTGGKLFANSNDLSQQVNQALEESSAYYVLAWEPDDEQINNIFRNIEVSVKNRSDLLVRFQTGYLAEQEAKKQESTSNKTESGNDNSIEKSLYSATSSSSFPVYMVPDYAEMPEGGAVINVGIQIPYKFIQLPTEENEKSSIKIKAEVFNDKGRVVAEYEKPFAINYEANKSGNGNSPAVTYNITLKPAPGFYQIRVAAQDTKSGKIGNVNKWIEVPDLTSGEPALSSLIVNNVLSDGAILRNADGRYAKKGDLRYLLYIYQTPNQKSQLSKEFLSVNEKIYYRNKVILNQESTPQQDQTGNFFYGGDIPMNSLNSGRYEIEITVTNKKNKKISTRWATFDID